MADEEIDGARKRWNARERREADDRGEEFSPEESARRFNAALKVMIMTPPISDAELKTRLQRNCKRGVKPPEPHEISTEELEERSAYPDAIKAAALAAKAGDEIRKRAAAKKGVERRWGADGMKTLRQVDEALMLMAEGLSLEEAAAKVGVGQRKVRDRIKTRERRARSAGSTASAPKASEALPKRPKVSSEAEEAVGLICELGFTIEEAAKRAGDVNISQVKRLLEWMAATGANMGMYPEAMTRRKSNWNANRSRAMVATLAKKRADRLRESE